MQLISANTVSWVSVSHREDYLRVLLDAAIELGMDLQLGACVERIDFDKTEVELADGRIITGDVIIGADGQDNNPQVSYI